MRALEEERSRFRTEIAPVLAKSVSSTAAATKSPSARFASFDSADGFIIIGGVQEENMTDRALAYGLECRGDRPLFLVLPAGYEFPTLQRSALLSAAGVRIWTHTVRQQEPTVDPPQERAVPTEEVACATLLSEKAQPCPEAEFAKATKALHLPTATESIFSLVEWATTRPQLDPGHRQGLRAWQCAGQKVLSLQQGAGKLTIKAGIHTTKDTAGYLKTVTSGQRLTAADVKEIETAVVVGIEQRLGRDGKYRKADEHWLQSVIRRHPKVVGIEQPALREVPAWRPSGGPTRWGRGFVDLIGLDGHGDIRVVETLSLIHI